MSEGEVRLGRDILVQQILGLEAWETVDIHEKIEVAITINMIVTTMLKIDKFKARTCSEFDEGLCQYKLQNQTN